MHVSEKLSVWIILQYKQCSFFWRTVPDTPSSKKSALTCKSPPRPPCSRHQTPGLELQYFSKLGLSVRQSSYYVIFNRISRAKVYSEQKVTHRTKLPQYLSRSSGSSFYKMVSTTFTAGWLSLP